MTTQDVLALAKAGYTAEQISALAAAEQTQMQEQEQPQEQEQKPKQKQPKQKQPKQKPEQEQPQEQEHQPDIIAELREIKTALLKGAFIGAQQPEAQDAEAALAAIINPPDVLELLGKK